MPKKKLLAHLIHSLIISMIENELEMLLGLESHTDEQLKRIEELYAEHGKAKERQLKNAINSRLF